jgi:hypothetical protein
MIGPAADTAQRDDERPPQLRQGILDGDGLGSRHLSSDQSHGLKIAKGSSKHSLRDVSQTTSQPSVSLWPFLQRVHDLYGPLPDEKRGHHFRPAAKSIFHFALDPSGKNFFKCDGRARIASSSCLCRGGHRGTLSVFCSTREREHACTYLTKILFKKRVTLGRVSE